MVTIIYDLCNKEKIINLEEECRGYKRLCKPYQTRLTCCQETPEIEKPKMLTSINDYFSAIERHVFENIFELFAERTLLAESPDKREAFLQEPFTPGFMVYSFSNARNEMYAKSRYDSEKLKIDMETFTRNILTFDRVNGLNAAVRNYIESHFTHQDHKLLVDVFDIYSNKFMENLINSVNNSEYLRIQTLQKRDNRRMLNFRDRKKYQKKEDQRKNMNMTKKPE